MVNQPIKPSYFSLPLLMWVPVLAPYYYFHNGPARLHFYSLVLEQEGMF